MEWMTVLRLNSPSRAVEIRSLLESAGLTVELKEVGSFQAGRDQDEILVQVPEAERERALRLLQEDEPVPRRLAGDDVAATHVDPPEPTEAKDEDEEDKPLEPREELARFTFRLTVLGVLIPILLPVALFFLVRVIFMRGKLEGRSLAGTWFAGILFLAPIVLLLAAIYGHDPDADMKAKPVPAELVGRWNAATVQPRGESVHQLDLHADGKMRYSVTGAEATDYEGWWAYENFDLVLRFRRARDGSSNKIGRTSRWRMVGLEGDTARFDLGDVQMTFRRK